MTIKDPKKHHEPALSSVPVDLFRAATRPSTLKTPCGDQGALDQTLNNLQCESDCISDMDSTLPHSYLRNGAEAPVPLCASS